MVEHRARKRFGQNFLQQAHIVQRIVNDFAPKTDQHLVEIGPGLGALTQLLVASKAQVEAIEIDRDLIDRLNARFANKENFSLHQADALTYDFSKLYQQKKLRLIGNLPYNIATPLIFHLLDYSVYVEDMYFMLQKEVAQRLVAQAGEPHYGRLGLMVQYRCQVELLFCIDPSAFKPVPKVDSAMVRIKFLESPPYPATNKESFAEIVKQAFSMRRKTLANNLKKQINKGQLSKLGVNPSERAENITLEQFVRLANWYDQSKG